MLALVIPTDVATELVRVIERDVPARVMPIRGATALVPRSGRRCAAGAAAQPNRHSPRSGFEKKGRSDAPALF